MVNEIRKDYLLERYSIIATNRLKRPKDFRPVKTKEKKIKCPFCPGNEDMTPPTIFKINGKRGWDIRVIENKFPALSKKANYKKKLDGFTNCFTGVGHHEVVVESPSHSKRLDQFSVKKIKQIIDVYQQRFVVLSKDKNVRFVAIFRNHGKAAGNSLSHPHSQIIATPFVPELIAREMNASSKYRRRNRKCIFCDIVKKERRSKRFVYENKSFLAICPFASIVPYETWIITKRHVKNIAGLKEQEKTDLADALRAVLVKMNKQITNIPYNYYIHQAPLDSKNNYHMHLEILPVLTVWAGFEKCTGAYINPVSPEIAAKELRSA